jgi:hypothetical protein
MNKEQVIGGYMVSRLPQEERRIFFKIKILPKTAGNRQEMTKKCHFLKMETNEANFSINKLYLVS